VLPQGLAVNERERRKPTGGHEVTGQSKTTSGISPKWGKQVRPGKKNAVPVKKREVVVEGACSLTGGNVEHFRGEGGRLGLKPEKPKLLLRKKGKKNDAGFQKRKGIFLTDKGKLGGAA